jgi:2-polyprenyl-6-methoxyphenol hydroxylase-like FAD-dependent oxidoreductase
MKAIIVGGGIGGMAAAVALTRSGWQVEVLEQAGEFGEVGAGLSVWPNALRALDALDLGAPVRERALLAAQAGIKDASGRWLAHTDTAELERRYGPVAMVHRADLLDVLRAAVPAEALRPGVVAHAARPDGTVAHSAGESAADLVVGADGIHSAVRRSLWPEAPTPRYAAYTSWRMITAPMRVREGVETWGRGERFGFAPLPDGRVYCFAAMNASEGAADEDLAGLRRRFGGWHDPIPALLDAVDEEAVRHDDLYELPPLGSYVAGKVALVGDAAHAMTPNLGQGACQAIEDAVVLADALGTGGLQTYDRTRRRRTQMIARRSRLIGAVAQWSSPLAVTLRDTAVRLMPGSSFLRSFAPILNWTPPSPSPGSCPTAGRGDPDEPLSGSRL